MPGVPIRELLNSGTENETGCIKRGCTVGNVQEGAQLRGYSDPARP